MVTRKKKTVKKSIPEKKSTNWLAPYEEFERFIDNYFNRNWPHMLRPEYSRLTDLWGTFEMHAPNMDMIDRDNEVVVRVELPGVEKKDLDISITNDILTVKGNSSKELTEEKGNYYRSEIKKGSISRTISLPAGVDSSKADAKFKDGLLELTIPKITTSKRKIIKIT